MCYKVVLKNGKRYKVRCYEVPPVLSRDDDKIKGILDRAGIVYSEQILLRGQMEVELENLGAASVIDVKTRETTSFTPPFTASFYFSADGRLVTVRAWE